MEENKNSSPDLPYSQNYAPYQPKPKVFFSLEKRDQIFALLALILSLFGVSVGIWDGFRIGFTVSYILYFILITVYLAERIQPFPLACGVLAVVGSGVFAVSEGADVNFFLILTLFALSAVWIDSLRGSRLPETDIGFLRRIFTSTFGRAFGNLSASVRSLFLKKDGKTGNLGKILIGCACALPVLLVIIPLLVSSDAAFEGLLSNILDDLAEAIPKAVLGIAFSAGLISYGFSHRFGADVPEKKRDFSGIDTAITASFLSVLSICYLAYLFSQLAYFFNAFSGILPEEFNAAAYARRGFFELCAIAVINFALLFATFALSRKQDGKPALIVRILSVFICLFTLTITATAFSKMVMYIGRFGMTRLRITTSAFMVFLSVVFLALLCKYFLPKTPVAKVAVIAAACVLLVLGYGNVDRVVASYNINAYHTGALTSLDVDTVSNLGTAAVPYMVELTQDSDKKIAKKAEDAVYEEILQLYLLDKDSIRRPEQKPGMWNLSRHRAYQALDDYLAANRDSVLTRFNQYDDPVDELY